MHATQILARPLTGRAMADFVYRRALTIMKHKRNFLSLRDHVYISSATAEGQGRNGIVKSNGDAPLEIKMSMPRNGGGKGEGQNPEQLFAMSYSSCFLGALQLAAARAKKMDALDNAKIHTRVVLGHPTEPGLEGFRLRVEIDVEGCNDEAIIDAAHEFCPYSRALMEGAEVKVTMKS